MSQKSWSALRVQPSASAHKFLARWSAACGSDSRARAPDQETIFQDAASVEKKRNLVCRGERTDISQVGQRYRMAATGIDAELDVNTTHLIGALLVNQRRLPLIDIEIAT